MDKFEKKELTKKRIFKKIELINWLIDSISEPIKNCGWNSRPDYASF